AFLIQSCEKDAKNGLGKQIQPDEDILGSSVVDTFAFTSRTLDQDSLPLSGLSGNLAGSYNDPVFGQVDVASYFQVRLAAENINFGNLNDIAVDSVVFSLVYNGGFYGDTSSNVQFNVQRMDESFSSDSVYFSGRDFAVQPALLNETEGQHYQIRPRDLVKVGKDFQPAQLRIKLKNSVGQEIMGRSGTSDLANNTAFVQFFKGLYLSATPITASGQGVIAYFNPLHIQSKLAVHYHHLSVTDTLVFNIPLNTASARVTNFKFNYAGTPVQQQLAGAVAGDQEVYIQAGAGTKAEIKFAGLTNLADSGNLVVNKAELILPVVPGSLTPFNSSARLLLLAIKADGTKEAVLDQSEGDTFYGGFFNTVDNSYHFTITRYVQQILNGVKPNLGLEVISASSGITANRTILAGYNNSQVKPKLKITYTKP
ncbi:MAG: DUF4270 domain-containing protein, partial [Bacteroidota bacterium]